jgi:hypothetical protein
MEILLAAILWGTIIFIASEKAFLNNSELNKDYMIGSSLKTKPFFLNFSNWSLISKNYQAKDQSIK